MEMAQMRRACQRIDRCMEVNRVNDVNLIREDVRGISYRFSTAYYAARLLLQHEKRSSMVQLVSGY